MKKYFSLASKTAVPLFLFVFINACGSTNYYYKPNPVNAPALADKGDIHASVNFAPDLRKLEDSDNGVGDKASRGRLFSVQVAASPVKHLGIMASYTNFHYQPAYPGELPGGIDNNSTNFFEMGAGTYTVFKQKNRVRLYGDLYAGYGVADMKSDINMRINKYFIQPGLGIRWPWIDASFNVRMAALKFSQFNQLDKSDSYLREHNLIDTYDRRIDEKLYLFMEPSFTFRGGYKYVKTQLQLAWVNQLTEVLWGYHDWVFTLGIYLSWDDFVHRNDKHIKKMKL